MILNWLIDASDFLAAVLFIYGLKRMSSPLTARSGILTAGIGMLAAVLVAFLYIFSIGPEAHAHLAINIALSVLALAIGLGWAWLRGRAVAITAMPQMVALYNGMGGGAAAAIAAVELFGGKVHNSTILVITMVGALIGAISLSGSIIAWAKLDGRMNKTWRFKHQQLCNGLVFLLTLGLGYFVSIAPHGIGSSLTGAYFIAALLFGVLMTVPIGGADMPVVISLYNAFTGLAVGLEGFVLQNPALMIAGMVVGSAGTLLTLLMAKAMNRSVSNVLFSNFGDVSLEQQGDIKGSIKSVDASDAATMMRYASKVMIVPGYGLAAAQAQQKLYELIKLLQSAGAGVKFAIHPVAGRMPGHMDVLLAEAGVPYDMIEDLEVANDEFGSADVALVIGANDVVNPAARTNKASPIYGMPILNADQSHQIYVVKRGQGKGYAGIENELFYRENCNLVYGDAQAVLTQMIQAVKDLIPAEEVVSS